jgi:hypothetical protein
MFMGKSLALALRLRGLARILQKDTALLAEEQEGGCRSGWRFPVLYRSLAINAGVCYTGTTKMIDKQPVPPRVSRLMPISFPHAAAFHQLCLPE